MSFDPAHQSTLVELARVQKEVEDLRRYAQRLRDQCEIALGYALSPILAAGLRAVLAGEIEPQDPIAAADLVLAIYRSAVISRHVYQDRDPNGAIWDGLDVDYRHGDPDIELTWEGEPGETPVHAITLAQAEQLRDALTEILARENAAERKR